MSLRYVAFDPGETTGIVGWDNPLDVPPPVVKESNQEKVDKFLQGQEDHPPEVFIFEEYRVFNNEYNHQGSKVYTIQVIGQIKAFARRHKILLVEQRREYRKTGLLWAGITIPKGHMPNWMSAYGHGYYYLRKNNLVPSRVLQERGPA